MTQSTHRWLIGPVLALVVLGGGYAVLTCRAQPPTPQTATATATATDPSAQPGAATVTRTGNLLRLGRNVPGDAKPILIDADDIYTWNEQGKVALLLRGKVLVQQNVVQARFEQAVAWVDVASYKTNGVLHM